MPQSRRASFLQRHCFLSFEKNMLRIFFNFDFVETGEKEAAYARTGETCEGCMLKVLHPDN
jgi:hypothetical protein